MVAGTIPDSQQKAAKAAGIAYLFTFAVVVYVNFGIHDRLIVSGDAAETARRILAHVSLFRVGILGDLLYCAGIVVQIAALYVILAPVGRGLALTAALLRFVWVLAWLVMTISLCEALRLLKVVGVGPAFAPEQTQVLARLFLGSRFDDYYVGLLFGSAASTICGYQWLRSRYVPRVLGVIGLLSSAWCVVCALIFLVEPKFADVVNLWWFDAPMGLFEIALSVWLLTKGLAPPAPAVASR